MKPQISRRKFLERCGEFAGAATVLTSPAGALLQPVYHPPTPVTGTLAGVRFGYAAITWGDKVEQAVEDISSVGFRGIQLRSNVVKDFRPDALRELLHQHQLDFVGLSSGDVHIDPSMHASDLDLHTTNAKYLHDAGGLYLQVLDQEVGQSSFTASDYKYLGGLLTEIGKRTSDMGIGLGYHNHLNSVSEHPEGLVRLLDAADPHYVKLVFDIAHYQAGGGDPAKAIREFRDRLLFLHIKDLGKPFDRPNDPKRLEDFVELGNGMVNLPAVFEAIREIKFQGWAIVELDSENDKSRTPKESAIISKKYLEEKLGITV